MMSIGGVNLISLNHDDVLGLLPDRNPDSHKGNYGKIMLLCGSRGYTGAPALAAMGALRSGAGLVYLCVPECIYEIEAIKLLEPIVLPLPDNGCTLSVHAAALIDTNISGKDALLVGPGLGRSEGVTQSVLQVLANFDGPIVLDADGINAVCRHKDILRERTSPTILTPHEGEFRRLYGMNYTDREVAAKELARDLGCIVLLKGNRTIITDGDTSYINQTGNPGMAVGGSGDLLSGILVSLLGQRIAPMQAAACAAWLHGSAGDVCAERIGQYGMLPTDMLEELPRLMK